MNSLAVILEGPERLALRELELTPAGPGDVVIDIAWSGISSGTEKLLWTGRMPDFPGMGYPLVPGYESLGRIIDAGCDAQSRIGDWVFVPGANCYTDARGLFGGTANRVVVPSARALPVPERLGQSGVLCALAATALHAINGGTPPDLIIGHGVLGRLLARLTTAIGAPTPTVWETNEARRTGAQGYEVLAPEADERRDYSAIYDASGDASIVDAATPHLVKGGEITLAGFYAERVNFAFPAAFMKEARLRIAAEWQPRDLTQTLDLIETGRLDLSNLITDARPASAASEAYPQAFNDPACLKMVLDWSAAA
ncbi:chlorophyll synthesis pathway protein BchC [Erythrobacter rubeus]|uniref:Chlorophyll synthesis pathway protein BchC n=1 Tax=Erythrobacter rubeus TaxID=2760803 RepID=A0ABR8KL76_9SPHN|nr:chlorophyll synthesis pathway protein BchC [Erythrobacter rubeus]MBD2841119.1 chlorophyll synthesis pathway protein BchC [Erythrobacter rubeus]